MIGIGTPSRGTFATLCALVVILAAPAQEAVPGWSARVGAVGGANPTVLGMTGGVTHTTPLYPDRAGVLWDSARLEGGIDLLFNPSFTDASARLFIEPVAVFDLTLRLGVRGFYDAFGLGLASLDGYGDPVPSATGDDYSGASEAGWFAGVAPRLKMALGPFIAANTFSATRYDFGAVQSRFIAEPLTLSAVERTDWVLENEAVVLYRLPRVPASFASIGPSYRVAWVPASLGTQEPSHRLALSGIYVFEPAHRVTVQGALFLGMYINGEPIERDRPFALAALTVTRTVP